MYASMPVRRAGERKPKRTLIAVLENLMKVFGKTLGLLLVGLALSSCGGGGGNGGSYSPPRSGSITLNADRVSLPLNSGGALPFVGSPYMATVSVSFRSANGTLEAPNGDATFSIDNPNIATLSIPDKGDTEDVNEFTQRYVSVPQTLNNGSATVFVNSFVTAGTATLTASAVDPQTNVTVTKTLTFTVTSGVGQQPATVQLIADPGSVYLPDSGAATSSTITARVLDGGGQPVPNPGSGNSGYDNIQFEIVGDANGARLSANAAGGPASGTSVSAHTVNGIATASFLPGTVQGPVQIKGTVDRSDNNVSNGISDPVSATTTVVVSDGKLYSLVLTSPTTSAIEVNPVSDNVQPTDGSTEIPTNPNGTYSLTVSALGVDRQGNPVVPGTPIEFGVVDAPMTGFPDQGPGGFLITGNDGDPQENGTLFTAAGGRFRSAGGGAGPGDTLLVFGDVVDGNRDLESARQIQSVNSETSLNVTYRFNPNDDTGTSVNHGPVLPYVIGRAVEGNIGATATTNAKGIATTQLTYPVSRIGKGALIWARGAGSVVGGTPRLVTEISGGGFPGVAPGKLVVSQTPLPGNATLDVTVCLYDALGAAIQGSGIGFGFTNLGLGTGSIDGTPTAGTFANPTGVDGCTTGVFTTSGLTGSSGGGSGDSPSVSFTAGPGVPAEVVPIQVSGSLLLQAAPSGVGAGGGTVTLLLTDSSGNPVPNAQLSGECTGGAGLAGLLGNTDANGRASVTVTGSGIAAVCLGTEPKTGTCTFKTGLDSGPTAKVTVTGGFLSPTDPSCTDQSTTNPTLTVNLQIAGGSQATSISVTSTPAGLSCSAAISSNQTCSNPFATGDMVTLKATTTPANRPVQFVGDCVSGAAGTAQVTMSSDKSCTIIAN